MVKTTNITQVLHNLATWYEYRHDDPNYRKTADALKEVADRIAALEAKLAEVKEMYAREGRKAMLEAERAEAAEARVKELEEACNQTEAQALGLAYDLKAAEVKIAEYEAAILRMYFRVHNSQGDLQTALDWSKI